MSDRAFTHVALIVADLDASVSFYRRYAGLQPVHEREERDSGSRVARMHDASAAFVLVLACPARLSIRRRLTRALTRLVGPISHLGVECASRADVDSLCELARREGRLRKTPRDAGPPVGYYGMIADPDGNDLELSYGQEVRVTLERAPVVSV